MLVDERPTMIGRHGELTYPCRGTTSAIARRTVTERLTIWGLPAIVDDARIVVSELVANAAQHTAGEWLGLTVLRMNERTVQISVRDSSRCMPQLVDPGPEVTHGRGLTLIDTCAYRWGVTIIPTGKRVWADVRSPVPPEPWDKNDGDSAW